MIGREIKHVIRNNPSLEKNLMAKITINGEAIKNDGLAAFLSNLTKTATLGATVISCAEFIGDITVSSNGEGESVNLSDVMEYFPLDSVVEIVDAGETPRPRRVTWEGVYTLASAAVRAYPAAKKIEEIGADVKGLVTFLDKGSAAPVKGEKKLSFKRA